MTGDARIAVGIPTHPKTKKVIRRIGEAGAWHLVCLFLWTAANRSSGDLSGMTAEDIELAVDWRGTPDAFVDTLVDVGFIDGEAGSYRIHDWEDHNPWASGHEMRSAKARWNAIKRHEGIREADVKVPEWAARRHGNSDDAGSSANSNKTDATSTKNDAASNATTQSDDAGSKIDNAAAQDATSTKNDAASNASCEKSDAPSPSPSPSPSPKAKGARGKQSAKCTFAQWLDSIPEGEDAIPATHHVFRYASDAGIPRDFVNLAWRWFENKYTNAAKRYIDWPRAFRNSVEGNWGRLWWITPDGKYQLTTVGQQLVRTMDRAA